MPGPIDFYFDFRSPYAFLSLGQLRRIASESGRQVRYRPVNVLDLMAAVGNRPTSIESPAKRQYVGVDVGRWAMAYGVPMTSAPRLMEIDPGLLLRGAVAAIRADVIDSYCDAVFSAIWQAGFALSHAEDLLRILLSTGVQGAEALASAGASEDEALEQIKAEAVAAGAFGVPSFVVDGQLYFGNDRLSFLEKAVAR